MARGRRLAAVEDWTGAYLAFRSAASVASQPLPEANAAAGYAALRAGHLDVATELNRQAFSDAAGDDELRAKVAFNQGLGELQAQAALRAALLFDLSLQLREHPSVRAKLRGLPDVNAVCDRPSNMAELCECNARDAGNDANLLPLEVDTCSVVGESSDKRFLAVHQLSTASESLSIPSELMLVERLPDGLHLQRYLEQVDAGSTATPDVELVSITERRIHDRNLLVVRSRTTDFIKGNAGTELTTYTQTSEVLCVVDAAPADCKRPLMLRMEEATTQFVRKPRGDDWSWEAEPRSSEFVQYDYSISSDGWLTPNKQGGKLLWDDAPQRLRLW